MTEQEAICCLKEQIKIQPCGNVALAFEMAINALEKQVPKKPNGIHCGSCNYVLIMSHELYCPRCGQRVHWT